MGGYWIVSFNARWWNWNISSLFQPNNYFTLLVRNSCFFLSFAHARSPLLFFSFLCFSRYLSCRWWHLKQCFKTRTGPTGRPGTRPTRTRDQSKWRQKPVWKLARENLVNPAGRPGTRSTRDPVHPVKPGWDPVNFFPAAASSLPSTSASRPIAPAV